MSVPVRFWMLAGAVTVAGLFAPPSSSADFALRNTPTECILQQVWDNSPPPPPSLYLDPGSCAIEVTWSDTPDQCPQYFGNGEWQDGRSTAQAALKTYFHGFYDTFGSTHVSGGPFETRTFKQTLSVNAYFDDVDEVIDGEKLVGTDMWKATLVCEFAPDVESTPQAIPIIVRGPNYRPPPGADPPGPSTQTIEKVNQLRAARAELEADKREREAQRQEMEEAIEELEAANEVYCGVAGSLGTLQGLHAFQWNGFHHVGGDVLKELSLHYLCSRIPDLIKGYLDAEGKLARNAQMIKELDHAIGIIQDELNLYETARATSRPPTSAIGSRQIGGSARKPPSPLAILQSRRTQALAAMDALSSALGKGQFDVAKTSAQTAADQLAALPVACVDVRRYLRKSGAGNRLSRSRIIGALRRLRPNSLSRSAVAFARTFHMSRAEMRKSIRRAKKVPRSRIKAISLPDLICSPRLDAIDRSLAGTLGKLAAAL